ncbi:hypothetical protein HK100_008933 [Physocladia obscura]|uniref:Zn(2)-C6 fungal-type domain-containing protein n=1 Tax=Physocladia obscura TaxID=109957 RepID=A0AAD5XJI6_9FUNG|nr:hypothetical protein HK100_008933 [Physocladia obscura]
MFDYDESQAQKKRRMEVDARRFGNSNLGFDDEDDLDCDDGNEDNDNDNDNNDTVNGNGNYKEIDQASSAPVSIPAKSTKFAKESNRKRIPRACDPCRRKRAKCSGDTPCALCVAKPHLCVYAPLFKTKREDVDGTAANSSQSSSSSAARLDAIERRLGSIENILSRVVPLLEKSATVIQTSQNQLQQQNPVVNLPRRSTFTPISTPSATQKSALSHTIDASYKTGGFLVNTEETALTFWGSTSALGGSTNNAHLYKSIPRYVHGTLMIHIPARTIQQEVLESQSTKNTPVGSLSSLHSASPLGRTGFSDQVEARQHNEDGNSLKGSLTSKMGSIPPFSSLSTLSVLLGPVQLSDLIPLPEAFIDMILKNFWEQFHPQFPLVDKLWFTSELKNLRSLPCIMIESHWRFILLLTSVVALMVNFTPSLSMGTFISKAPTVTASSEQKSENEAVLKHLLDSYKKILFDHFEIADVIAVQSLLFVVMVGAFGRGSRFTGTWGYMGLAVRFSHELGLHRSIKELGVQHRTFDKDSIALRNRTWHCVNIMETYTCIWTGRPLGINDSDWDAEYPSGKSEEMVLLRQHIDLVLVIGKILRFANRAQHVDVDFYVSDISQQLEKWWIQLDNSWRDNKFQDRWNSKAMMSLMYHSAVILFHRTAFFKIDHPDCLNSSRAITALVSRFEAGPMENECIVLFPTFTYCAMMACTVHINGMLASSASGDTVRFITAVGDLEKCMRVFDNLRGIFINAERCWKTVLDFLAAKGIKLDELVKAARNSAENLGISSTASSSSSSSSSSLSSPSATISFKSESVETPKLGTLSGTTPLTEGLNSLDIASWSIDLIDSQKPHLQQTSAPSGSSSSNLGGLSSGLGLWDGLSLFDLAGLGGLNGMMETDFSLFTGLPPQQQQQQQQHQFTQSLFPQQSQLFQPHLQQDLPQQQQQQQNNQLANNYGGRSLPQFVQSLEQLHGQQPPLPPPQHQQLHQTHHIANNNQHQIQGGYQSQVQMHQQNQRPQPHVVTSSLVLKPLGGVGGMGMNWSK